MTSYIFPTRGQIVVVKNKHVIHASMDDGITADGTLFTSLCCGLTVVIDIVYIIPRTHTTVLGGTAQPNNWSLEPNQKGRSAPH